MFEKEWIVALPNPFNSDVTVFIKGQETGEVSLRLTDTRGSVVEVVNAKVTENETTTIRFTHTPQLAAGVYLLQYISKSQKRTLRLFKG